MTFNRVYCCVVQRYEIGEVCIQTFMYKIHFIINTGQTQYFKIDLLNNVPDTDRFREYVLDTGVSSFAELSIVY